MEIGEGFFLFKRNGLKDFFGFWRGQCGSLTTNPVRVFRGFFGMFKRNTFGGQETLRGSPSNPHDYAMLPAKRWARQAQRLLPRLQGELRNSNMGNQ